MLAVYTVAVLLTGGTFLSKRTRAGLAPSGQALRLDKGFKRLIPQLSGPFNGRTKFTFKQIMNLDSSVMVPADWLTIAIAVHQAYQEGADAVVVVHGTDTMEYSAGGVAHLFCSDLHGRNLLPGPVVFTGAMRSIFTEGTDAIKNFHDAVSVALWGISNRIGDVMIVFSSEIMPAARASKFDPRAFNAFEAPALKNKGRDYLDSDGVQATPARYRRSEGILDPKPPTNLLKSSPVLLSANPLLSEIQLRDIASAESIGALILQAPGDGNLAPRFFGEIARITDKMDKPVVVVSAHDAREVKADAYAIGKEAVKRGIIPGGDISHTQAVLKLALLLQLYTPEWGRRVEFVRKTWNKSMIGEITQSA